MVNWFDLTEILNGCLHISAVDKHFNERTGIFSYTQTM